MLAKIVYSLFWKNMAPKAGGRPQGELAAATTREFGSFDIVGLGGAAAGVDQR